MYAKQCRASETFQLTQNLEEILNPASRQLNKFGMQLLSNTVHPLRRFPFILLYARILRSFALIWAPLRCLSLCCLLASFASKHLA